MRIAARPPPPTAASSPPPLPWRWRVAGGAELSGDRGLDTRTRREGGRTGGPQSRGRCRPGEGEQRRGRAQRHPRGRQSRPAGGPCVCPARAKREGAGGRRRGRGPVSGGGSGAGPASLFPRPGRPRRPHVRPPQARGAAAPSRPPQGWLCFLVGVVTGFRGGGGVTPFCYLFSGGTRGKTFGTGALAPALLPPRLAHRPWDCQNPTSRVRGGLGGIAESGRLSGLKGLSCLTPGIRGILAVL